MDTIDVSNLNRQFLFRVEDVGKPKAEVAAERVMQRVKEYDEKGSPDQSTIKPLVDGGTEGFKGHARVIFPGLTPCFHCSHWPFPPQITFPLCTLAETPRSPAHCIEYPHLIQWGQDRQGESFDADNPEHMEWIYDQAVKRGEQFDISGITYSLTQGAVKNIVPAIASTNAIVAATCALETLKIATMCSTGMEVYMQYTGTEGIYMRTVPHDKDPNCIMCSPGVPVEVDTTCTLQKFIDQLLKDARFKLKLSKPSVSYQGDNLYMQAPPVLEEMTRPNLELSLLTLMDGKTSGVLNVNDRGLTGVLRVRVTFTPEASSRDLDGSIANLSACIRDSDPSLYPDVHSSLYPKGADNSPSLDSSNPPFELFRLPRELLCKIFKSVRDENFEDLVRLNCLSKQAKDFLARNKFSFTLYVPYFYFSRGQQLQLVGFDTSQEHWKILLPPTFLPAPEPLVFEHHLVFANGGLMCFYIAHEGKLIVGNSLTGEFRVLPPFNHPRNPYLMHLIVDTEAQSFRVVAAGSASAQAGDGEQDFSKVTEVFRSSTWEWIRTGDLPGPEYALNEYQTGVYQDGNILCIASLEAEQKGLLICNVEEGRWLGNSTPLPSGLNLQLVQCNGKVCLFFEEARPGLEGTEHCVDRVELIHSEAGGPVSRELSAAIRTPMPEADEPRFQFSHEYVCVPYGESQLCIFNTLKRTGLVYDVPDDGCPDQEGQVLLPPPEAWCGESFYSLNPLSFPLDLSFISLVQTRSVESSPGQL